MVILKDLKLLETWNAIGQAYVVGATAYDLLVDQDIDTETFCVHPNAAFALVLYLADPQGVAQSPLQSA